MSGEPVVTRANPRPASSRSTAAVITGSTRRFTTAGSSSAARASSTSPPPFGSQAHVLTALKLNVGSGSARTLIFAASATTTEQSQRATRVFFTAPLFTKLSSF
jgi:hypothetical protein